MLAQSAETPTQPASCLRSQVVVAMMAAVLPLSMVYGQSKPTDKDLVTAEAHLSVDRLPAGEKCQILIRLTVNKEWHIGANPPFNKDDVATKVEWKGKLGTKLVQVKYPAGKKFTLEDGTPQLVYDGKVDIRGTLEIPADAGGSSEEMEIVVYYQACNDKVCRIPTTVKLAAKLPVAKPGETVKQINEKLFAPPPK